MFTVWKAKEGEKKLDIFDQKRKVMMSKIMEYRELSLSIRYIDKGRYFIVPATKKFGEYGNYYLNIYFSMPYKCKYLTGYEGENPLFKELSGVI